MNMLRFASLLLVVVVGAVHLWAGKVTADACNDRDVLPLIHAHAHNDYAHPRPLFDALQCGFCSVEADVFLVDGKLLVGHEHSELKPNRTLQTLYLDPLRLQVREHGGHVFGRPSRFYLLIDVKTEAEPTYRVMDQILLGYSDILSYTDEGKFHPGPITAVVSGNRAIELMTKQGKRFAGIDGRLSDLDSTAPANLMPWLSYRWGGVFRWQGKGPMPPGERTKLRGFVAKAHEHGRLVRFWATPEKEEFWQELLADGVDLLNTDQLPRLQKFLMTNRVANKP